MAEKKEDDKEQCKSIAEETFDETKKGRYAISVVETADRTKIIGFRKFFKSKKDAKEEITPRRGKSFRGIPVLRTYSMALTVVLSYALGFPSFARGRRSGSMNSHSSSLIPLDFMG
jgi:hypothetical protein